MTWLERRMTMIARSPETGAGAAAAGDASAGGAASGSAAGAGASAAGAPAAAKAWHDGVDPTTVGFWQNKGWDPADPRKVAEGLTKAYREVERFVGAPPDEMIRIPKTNAAPADISAYWQRIGVPPEAKDYDLAGVKLADGGELDSGFLETFRAAAHAARVPKDQAAGMLGALVKHMEANDKAELAQKTAIVKEQQDLLDKSWGTNKSYNLAIAERALADLGTAAGLTPEQIKQGWDALSKVGGIGATYAMEMLRTIGARMGEAPFVGAQPGQGGNNQVMSKQQALAEIESLKADKDFYKKLVLDRSVEARRRWDDLHKIAFAA